MNFSNFDNDSSTSAFTKFNAFYANIFLGSEDFTKIMYI